PVPSPSASPSPSPSPSASAVGFGSGSSATPSPSPTPPPLIAGVGGLGSSPGPGGGTGFGGTDPIGPSGGSGPPIVPLALILCAATLGAFFLIVGKRRRGSDEPEPVAVAVGAAAAPVLTVVAPRAAPLDDPYDEAHMPRWRRPSLKAARYASGVPGQSWQLAFAAASEAGVERRLVRYDLVRLYDQPDEIRSQQVGELQANDEVEVLDKRAGWLLVRTPIGSEGWVHRTTLGPAIEEAAPVDPSADDLPLAAAATAPLAGDPSTGDPIPDGVAAATADGEAFTAETETTASFAAFVSGRHALEAMNARLEESSSDATGTDSETTPTSDPEAVAEPAIAELPVADAPVSEPVADPVASIAPELVPSSEPAPKTRTKKPRTAVRRSSPSTPATSPVRPQRAAD
ncbi:MAG: SH3 domain-containing protein, partial [Candidatus Limnocylindrales bacterium]